MRWKPGGLGLVVLLTAAVAAMWFGLAGSGSRKRGTVTIISPPEGVTVPAGQAVEVRYRVEGSAQRAELLCDDVLLATDLAPAGRELRHTWLPTNPGTACCRATALDGRSMALVSTRRCLIVGTGSSPVRLGGP